MGCLASKEESMEEDDSRPKKLTGGRKNNADMNDLGLTTLTASQLSMRHPTQLKALQLRNNYLSDLPPELSACTSLEELHLDGNKFVSIPDVLQHLPVLTHLNLSNNLLVRATINAQVFARMPALKTLVLSMCNLRSIPASVGQCPQLTSLDVSFNEDIVIPPDLWANTANVTLEHVCISYCGLRGDLPAALAGLMSLRSLDVSGNAFNLSKPTFFGPLHCQHLVELKICGMDLSGVPPAVFPLQKLEVLDLSRNPIQFLDALAHLYSPARLRSLGLSSCQLEELPDGIDQVHSLTHLDISNNAHFTDTSSRILALPNLESLNVVGCLFCNNTDGRDTEWCSVSKLQHLKEIEWSVWTDKGKSSFNPYSTKFPIHLCGMPIEKLNGMPVKDNLFTRDRVATLINVLNDGYYKIDFLFEAMALWHHLHALKRMRHMGREYFCPATGTSVEEQARVRYRIELTVWRYIYFLKFQSHNFDTAFIPPMDVVAMHYAQMTVDPCGYRKDCFTVANRLMDCNYRMILSASDANVNIHRETWDMMVDWQMKNTGRNLHWLRYGFTAMEEGSSNPFVVGATRATADSATTVPHGCPNREELNLALVLDADTVEHYRKKGVAGYQSTLNEFFRVSEGFIRGEDHFERQGTELWTRYARFLGLYALHESRNRAVQQQNVSQEINSDATINSASHAATTSSAGIEPFSVVPTLGMRLMLHLHRTAHFKYDRCLDFLGIEPELGIRWSQTRESIQSTAALWNSVFTEPYLRDQSIPGSDAVESRSVDVEYNRSSQSTASEKRPSPRKVTIMPMDLQDA